jgi:uncharacterized membrane protein YedE/YeeE
MSIDTAAFTPLHSLAGGLLIGASSGWLLLSRGRIAGISGLLGQVLPGRDNGSGHFGEGARIALPFLLGLIIAPLLFRLFGWHGEPRVTGSSALLVVSGLLVGFGTRLGNGCTSGHGVCGISRLSLRSIIATLLFLTSAVATVWLQKMLP